jgi:hypothetical protein
VDGAIAAVENNPRYLVSADLALVHDYSTIAVIERRLVPVGEPYEHAFYDYSGARPVRRREVRQKVEQHYDLLRLDRAPRGTWLSAVAAGMVRLTKELYRAHRDDLPEAKLAGHVVKHPADPERPLKVPLAFDEGGIGKAALEHILQALTVGLEPGEPKVRLLPVTVHGGFNTTRDQGFYHVPKRDLVSAGLLAYQNGRLRVGKLRYRDVLEEELRNYRLKVNISTSHTAFEPLREGQHDDLLFAVCLGCWAWERAVRKVEYTSKPNHIMSDIPPDMTAQYGTLGAG